jgi:hypothetical protein
MEDENRRLKLLVAELSLHGEALAEEFKIELGAHSNGAAHAERRCRELPRPAAR